MTRAPERHALVVGVRPEKREEYLKLHSAVWPGVEQKLVECNIRNYSIFVFGDILFAYYEYVGEDHAADMATLAEDPETRRWWALTDALQQPDPERPPGTWWLDLPEIFHSD